MKEKTYLVLVEFLQLVQCLEDCWHQYFEQSYSDYINLHCDLDLFPHGTQAHNDAPPYQGWLQNTERCRRYLVDKAGSTDRQQDMVT